MRVRVKICGITRVEDGVAAASLGADAIGLVFYPPSPRAVDAVQATQIVARLPAFVTTVGLFVDASREQIAQVLDAVPLDVLQFHGNEQPQDCLGHGRPFIKALRMCPGLDVVAEVARYADAQGVLLDSYQPGVPGGTGQAFDWRLIPDSVSNKIILAGGLAPDNVAKAITIAQPYAVDVSGGVEAAKGVKDHARMAAFINEVSCVRTN